MTPEQEIRKEAAERVRGGLRDFVAAHPADRCLECGNKPAHPVALHASSIAKRVTNAALGDLPEKLVAAEQRIAELQRCPERRNDGPGPDELYRCVYHAGHDGPHWSQGTKWMEIDPEPGSDAERKLLDRIAKLEKDLATITSELQAAYRTMREMVYVGRHALGWKSPLDAQDPMEGE